MTGGEQALSLHYVHIWWKYKTPLLTLTPPPSLSVDFLWWLRRSNGTSHVKRTACSGCGQQPLQGGHKGHHGWWAFCCIHLSGPLPCPPPHTHTNTHTQPHKTFTFTTNWKFSLEERVSLRVEEPLIIRFSIMQTFFCKVFHTYSLQLHQREGGVDVWNMSSSSFCRRDKMRIKWEVCEIFRH